MFPWSGDSPRAVEGEVSYALPTDDGESRRVQAHNFRADAAKVAMLTNAGLPKVITISETMLLSECLEGIQAAEPAQLGSEYLYGLLGADFGDLLPAEFANTLVLYIKLAPERSVDIGDFLQIRNRRDTGCAKLYSVWSLEAHHIFCSDSPTPLNLWIERDRIRNAFELAHKDGYILLAFDCGGDLSLTACLINEHLYGWGQAQGRAPGYIFDLQAKERAIEDGLATLLPANPRHVHLRVRDSENPTEQPKPWREGTLNKPWRELTWGSYGESAVGYLDRILAYLPADIATDDRQWLRVTINEFGETEGPEANRVRREADFETLVTKVLTDDGGIPCYLVSGWTGKHMFVVALRANDPRFAKAYAEWVSTGICPLTCEQYSNGRIIKVIDVAWPKEFGPCAQSEESLKIRCEAVLEYALSGERWLIADANIGEFAERISCEKRDYVHCALTIALDETECAVAFKVT